jgi:hypothetical protein
VNDGEHFEAALQMTDPYQGLVQLALAFSAAGDPPAIIVQRFERFRTHLQQHQRDQDDDLILEVMDRIIGWCGPHAALFP